MRDYESISINLRGASRNLWLRHQSPVTIPLVDRWSLSLGPFIGQGSNISKSSWEEKGWCTAFWAMKGCCQCIYRIWFGRLYSLKNGCHDSHSTYIYICFFQFRIHRSWTLRDSRLGGLPWRMLHRLQTLGPASGHVLRYFGEIRFWQSSNESKSSRSMKMYWKFLDLTL